MTKTISDLFDAHVLMGHHRQLDLSDIIGHRNWDADLDAGTLRFGEDIEFKIGFLGSFADQQSTWLWSWGNNAMQNLSDEVLSEARQLKVIGEAEDVMEFKEAGFEADPLFGYQVAAIARGLFNGGAFYRGPYGAGAAFFIIKTLDVPKRYSQLNRVLRVITEAIQAYPFNHRPAVLSYFGQLGFETDISDGAITAHEGEDKLTVEFDEIGRVRNLLGTIGSTDFDQSKPQPVAPPPATKKTGGLGGWLKRLSGKR